MRTSIVYSVLLSTFILLSGCMTRVPESDTTPPTVSVTVNRGMGHNIFDSTDGQWSGSESCIKVPGAPTKLTLVAGDAGGVKFASLKVFPATVDPDSVEVTPGPGEASYSIRTERHSNFLEITLTPADDGSVRTGTTAVLNVRGELPIAVTATALDYSGNTTDLPQFDLRSPDDLTECRGNI